MQAVVDQHKEAEMTPIDSADATRPLQPSQTSDAPRRRGRSPPASGNEANRANELQRDSSGALGAGEAGAGGTATRMPSLRYTVTEVPPWHVCLILGFQHYLTMLGSTVVIPALLVPAMGGTPKDHARVVQTIFFVSGINTLIQTTIGDRLPIIQGGSFSFLKPAFAIIAIIQATMKFETEHDRFIYTMRELQGSIIGSSLLVIAIGYTGTMGALLRFISPVVVAPTVCMVGLSLYPVGFSGAADCLEQGLLAIVAVIMFSQVLKNVEVPLPLWTSPRAPALSGPLLAGRPSSSSGAAAGALAAGGGAGDGGGRVRSRVRIFELFPLLWSILLCWAVAGILTAAGVYDDTSPTRTATCRTDNTEAMAAAPWLYVPYPGQWGPPIFKAASIITMMAGALAAMIESTGDYYACARMCGAPVPPPYVISRGIGAEGMGCLMCGLFGTGNGTTSYAENIGAIGLTGVGSRRVVQAGAAIMIGLAVLGKFGALFASLPAAIVSGLFCCVFGLIAAVGLSNLQFTDQNSSRNLMVVGFAIYMALSIPYFFETYTTTHGHGPINTSSKSFNDISNTLFSTPMCVSLLLALVLDNAIAGSAEERGLAHWSPLGSRKRQAGGKGGEGPGEGGGASSSSSSDSEDDEDDPALDPRNDPAIKAVYDLPYVLQVLNERFVLPYRMAAYRAMRRAGRALRRAVRKTACWRWQRKRSLAAQRNEEGWGHISPQMTGAPWPASREPSLDIRGMGPGAGGGGMGPASANGSHHSTYSHLAPHQQQARLDQGVGLGLGGGSFGSFGRYSREYAIPPTNSAPLQLPQQAAPVAVPPGQSAYQQAQQAEQAAQAGEGLTFQPYVGGALVPIQEGDSGPERVVVFMGPGAGGPGGRGGAAQAPGNGSAGGAGAM